MDEAAGTAGLMSTTRVGAKCGRWNPTAEQVKVLTDLFTSGLRTPTTDQIQNISSYLTSFGKIESKNVFYWFQNHKARERHHKKRRRGVLGAAAAATAAAHDHLCLLSTVPEKKEAAKSCSKGADEEAIWELERDHHREIETLELFPLRSYEALEREKVRINEWREISFFDDGRDPPLDLSLSFF